MTTDAARLKLRKLKATINHDRTSPAERMAAQMAADRIAKSHGIDFDTVDDGLNDDDRSKFNFATSQGAASSIRLEERIASLLTCELFKCDIRAAELGAKVQFIFLIPKPATPEPAVQFFKGCADALHRGWIDYSTGAQRLFAFCERKACKPSFISGMFRGLREQLVDESAPSTSDFIRDLVNPKKKLNSAPPPPTSPIPKHNPFALVHVPRLAKALPKQKSRKAKAKSAKPKQEETKPEPQPEEESPPPPPPDMMSYQAGYTYGVRTKIPKNR